jgi:hypothetical protein
MTRLTEHAAGAAFFLRAKLRGCAVRHSHLWSAGFAQQQAIDTIYCTKFYLVPYTLQSGELVVSIELVAFYRACSSLSFFEGLT